jgi:hypothetical protein
VGFFRQDEQDLQDKILRRRLWAVEAGLSFKFQPDRSKTQEQSQFDAGRGQVIDQLYFIGHDQSVDGFQLQQHAIFHQQIGGKIANGDAFV